MDIVTFPILHFPQTDAYVICDVDHRIAQFLWNTTWATPEETLKGEEPGAACLTEVEPQERYFLHLQGGERCYITLGEKSLAESLLDFGVTKLCFKREGEGESLSQTYFQGLFEMEKEGLDWMKLSRRKFHDLPSSLFIDCEGCMCYYHHGEECLANGTAKQLYLTTSCDGIERLRARYTSQEYRRFFDNLKTVATELRGCAQLLIPDFYAYGDQFGQIMPKMKGDWFDFRPQFTPRHNILILRDVALGLLWMHSKDIVHLDVKLDNVLITSDYRGRLGDLDQCLVIRQEEKIPRYGTKDYMDPNLAQELSVGRIDALAADFFSFGVLLHICCSGKMLYRPSEGGAIGINCISPIANLDLLNLVYTLVYRGEAQGQGQKLQHHPQMPESMEQIISKLDTALSNISWSRFYQRANY